MSYSASISLFHHFHTVNGVAVVHSHIHADSHHDTKSGEHTECSITFIAQCSCFEYIDFSCEYLLKPLQLTLHGSKFVETTPFVASIHFQNLSLRAPPVV